jgi:hypothetical protein
MPKWLLCGFAAAGNFVVAVITYNTDRVLIPLLLAAAAVMFVIAAAGSARGAGGGGG